MAEEHIKDKHELETFDLSSELNDEKKDELKKIFNKELTESDIIINNNIIPDHGYSGITPDKEGTFGIKILDIKYKYWKSPIKIQIKGSVFGVDGPIWEFGEKGGIVPVNLIAKMVQLNFSFDNGLYLDAKEKYPWGKYKTFWKGYIFKDNK